MQRRERLQQRVFDADSRQPERTHAARSARRHGLLQQCAQLRRGAPEREDLLEHDARVPSSGPVGTAPGGGPRPALSNPGAAQERRSAQEAVRLSLRRTGERAVRKEPNAADAAQSTLRAEPPCGERTEDSAQFEPAEPAVGMAGLDPISGGRLADAVQSCSWEKSGISYERPSQMIVSGTPNVDGPGHRSWPERAGRRPDAKR